MGGELTLPPDQVRAMFDRITPSYDRMNRIMSLGMDGSWRGLAVRCSGAGPGDSALDVCCGTGDLAIALLDAVSPGGRVVGLDFSQAMLDAAVRKRPQIEWVRGDALSLPFADGEFAAATIGFGMRNLADHLRGFRELRRVVAPGGRVVCLELTDPPAWAAPFARIWTDRAVPLLGRFVAREADAYRYLPASVHRFPPADELAAIMGRAGLRRVRYRRLSGGAVAVHVGTVPA
jgi:demethylmenaquinone methyltransferase / 2-methoxy-6-polyprenyl-1,4-benzoquinol methylase